MGYINFENNYYLINWLFFSSMCLVCHIRTPTADFRDETDGVVKGSSTTIACLSRQREGLKTYWER